MRRVAVTGFGVVSPIGTGRCAFWDGLAKGACGIGDITRFDAGTFAVRLAGEVKDELSLPGPAAEVAADDPKVGFAHAACAEALSQAGIERLDGGCLLHIGTSLEIFDLRKVVCDGRADFKSLAERGLQIPLDTAARLIAQSFGRPERSMTNCSACAAGAQAIGHGFHEVRAGRCETAICGAFDSMINPLGVGGFQMLGALTTDNDRGSHACRPFDRARSGTVLGEGAAMFVMEPLERAQRNGKSVLAEICGYHSTLDAHSLSAPDPEGDGAARAMRGALSDAGITPGEIGHINVHGTGTRLNDEVEAIAIRRVFPETWERIPIAAVKSMTGHLIAAAGAVEAGACLLTLREGIVPPNPCLDAVGRGCELAHVTGTAGRFEGEYVLSNSFGFGGQNAALVLRKHDG